MIESAARFRSHHDWNQTRTLRNHGAPRFFDVPGLARDSSRRSRISMASRNDRQHCRGGCSVKRRRVGFLLTTLLMSVAASAQQPTNAGDRFGLAPGPHDVGFRLLVEQDHSRYVSASDGTGTHARPIRVYVWYPAKAASKPMRFGRYAALADDDVWPPEISGRSRDVLKFSHADGISHRDSSNAEAPRVSF